MGVSEYDVDLQSPGRKMFSMGAPSATAPDGAVLNKCTLKMARPMPAFSIMFLIQRATVDPDTDSPRVVN